MPCRPGPCSIAMLASFASSATSKRCCAVVEANMVEPPTHIRRLRHDCDVVRKVGDAQPARQHQSVVATGDPLTFAEAEDIDHEIANRTPGWRPSGSGGRCGEPAPRSGGASVDDCATASPAQLTR